MLFMVVCRQCQNVILLHSGFHYDGTDHPALTDLSDEEQLEAVKSRSPNESSVDNFMSPAFRLEP